MSRVVNGSAKVPSAGEGTKRQLQNGTISPIRVQMHWEENIDECLKVEDAMLRNLEILASHWLTGELTLNYLDSGERTIKQASGRGLHEEASLREPRIERMPNCTILNWR